MKHVLVTGATGFLGMAVRKCLTSEGIRVTAVDTRSGPEITRTNICVPAELDMIMSKEPVPDAVVHLAAAGAGDKGLVAGADTNTAVAVRTNIEGFVHVIEAAARHGVERVVWSSSTTVYGGSSEYTGPIDESAPFHPTTAYGATKASCEFLGPILGQRLGVQVVSLRLPMVYGPGRWYGGSQAPLVALSKALEDRRDIEIEAWENDADWIHVNDAASALLAVLRTEAPDQAFHVLGHRGSFADLARGLLNAAGKNTGASIRSVAKGAPDLPAISDLRLRRQTGWHPRFPDSITGAADYLSSSNQQR